MAERSLGTLRAVLAVCATVLCAVVLASCGGGAAPSGEAASDSSESVDAGSAPVRDTVTLTVTGDAPVLPEGSSPLMLRLEGCCANTEGELVYVAVDGAKEVDVIPGKYYAKWISPVTPSGDLFATPGVEQVIIIDEAHNEKRIAEGGASVETETDARLVWTEMRIPTLTTVNAGTVRALTLTSETLSLLEEGLLANDSADARAAYETASKNLGYGGAGAAEDRVETVGSDIVTGEPSDVTAQ